MKQFIFAILLLCTFYSGSSQALWLTDFIKVASHEISPLVKNSGALAEKKIIELSKLSDKEMGTKLVGKELGKLNLPKEVLEDTYMRIAIYQKKISRNKAEEMFSHLQGVEGFRTTLSKVIGNAAQKTKGHLNELEIANSSSRDGFKVIAIGKRFDDGLKGKETDVDLLLRKNSQTFAIEAKDYQPTTKMPLDKLRGDFDSLVSYAKQSGDSVVPVFTVTTVPSDTKYLYQVQYEAKKRGVQVIFGSPQIQSQRLSVLSESL